jgi:hypothetical protein
MTQPRAADTLGMPEAKMRALGYQMVEEVVVIPTWLAGPTERAIEVTDRASLEALIGGPAHKTPPTLPARWEPCARSWFQSSNMATIRAVGPYPFACGFHRRSGRLAGAGFNSIAASWVGGSGTAVTELVVIDWLRQCMRMPEGTQGVVVSGGSLANFTAFAAAFAAKGRGVVYTNDQTHALIKRNLIAIGLTAADTGTQDQCAAGI